MILFDLINQYGQLPIVDKILKIEDQTIGSYIQIIEEEKGGKTHYRIIPTDDFNKLTGAISSELVLDKDLKILFSKCGCLENYRKKICVHVTLLYALAVRLIRPQYYQEKLNEYLEMQKSEEHSKVLNKLINSLRTNSAYFKRIHLLVEIENKQGQFFLSLRVKYDKEYVVKNITEFIYNVENNKYYSYGQKLSFLHSYEVFDDESKEFYGFLINICHENSGKSISIRKSQFLQILELYHNSGIYYSTGGSKSRFYNIVELEKLALIVDDKYLYFDVPLNYKKLLCGVNYAYFINNEKIYSYAFKTRNEALIIDSLFNTSDKGLMIEADEIAFVSNLLPIMKNDVEIEKSFYDKFSLPEVKISTYFSYLNGIIYGEPKIDVADTYKNTTYVDQIIDGYLKCYEAFSFQKENNKYLLKDIDFQYKFLTSNIAIFKNYGDVFFDESVKNITLKKSSRVNVSVSYDVGLLNFKINGDKLSIEEIQKMLDAYHHKKQFVRLKNDVIMEIKLEDAKEIDNFLEDFNIKASELNGKIKRPLSYLFKLVENNSDQIKMDKKITELVRQIIEYRNIPDQPKQVFLAVLRPYQLEGFKWLKMLSKFGFGGILADDMGLGKTLEIITFLASDDESKPTLIVCPMSLVYNWENECNKWDAGLNIELITGNALERENKIKNINYNKKSIYITSYDSLRRDFELYVGVFRFVIADEAQYIKNQNALKSEAIKRINSQMNFALTGTPIENGLADLWSIFDYVMPGFLSNYSHFKTRYEQLIMQDDYETLDLLKRRVQPFILRRTKKDVLSELPEKTEEMFYCKLTNQQEEIYRAYVGQIKNDINHGGKNILSLITRLRQICITPELFFEEEIESGKIALAMELIKRAISSQHRVLLFSQFASVFPILEKIFIKEKIKYYILDGTTKAKDRVEMVNSFNNNEEIKVFMISLKAGGTGLNLVGADMVIHLDPWWNVSAENQATDRAYRIGQTKNVHVLKLVCKNTIEEKVLLLQKAKKELSEQIIMNETYKLIINKEELLKILD